MLHTACLMVFHKSSNTGLIVEELLELEDDFQGFHNKEIIKSKIDMVCFKMFWKCWQR
jgi:hypothetical protein